MQLQESDSIFSMGNNIMWPENNLEPKYGVIMLTGEELTKGPRPPLAVKGFVRYTEGSKMQD
jgi:hypothetical protein